MVYTEQNVIQFGKGDVRIWMGMDGTISEPQAMIIFQNQEPSPISRIEEDAFLGCSCVTLTAPAGGSVEAYAQRHFNVIFQVLEN